MPIKQMPFFESSFLLHYLNSEFFDFLLASENFVFNRKGLFAVLADVIVF